MSMYVLLNFLVRLFIVHALLAVTTDSFSFRSSRCLSLRDRDLDRDRDREIYCRNSDFDSELVPEAITDQSRSAITSIAKVLYVSFGALLLPKAALAERRQGAFEMDMEYYIKDLVGAVVGDSKNEAVTSGLKVYNRKNRAYAPPRKINREFADSIIEVVQNKVEVVSGKPKSSIISILPELLAYQLQYFRTFIPIKEEDISDQYFIDVYLYTYYLEAGKLIPTSEARVKLRSLVGEGILNLMYSKYNLPIPSYPAEDSSKLSLSVNSQSKILAKRIATLAKGIKDILNIFQANGIISGFSFDDEDLVDETFAFSSFSEGLPVSFQVTVLEPITILGFLQQAQADTFYHPEVVATTIVNYASQLGYRLAFEDYLLDREYRADNFDVQAQDILLELRLSR